MGDESSNFGTLQKAGDDVLIGGAADDFLAGDVQSGNRAVIGGNDELDGGDGNFDTAFYLGAVTGFTFNLVGTTLLNVGGVVRNAETLQVIDSNSHEGTDTLTNIEQIQFESTTYTLRLGTNGNDSGFIGDNPALEGTKDTNDLILGFGGFNTLYGDGEANTILNATTKDDVLVNGNGGGTLVGDVDINSVTITAAGNDVLIGGTGVDLLVGDVSINTSNINQAGNDVLIGGGGNDNLYGDVASSNLALAGGNDELDGGDGTGDIAYYLGKVTDFAFAYVGVGVGAGDVDHNISSFRLSDNTGHETNNTLGTGFDTLTNIERIQLGSALYALKIGTDSGDNNPGFDGEVNISNLILGFNGDDFLVGDLYVNADTITGSADALVGGSGNDELYGDIYSNSGNLTTAGNDILIGGEGNDLFYGDVGQGNLANIGGNDELDGGGDLDTAFYLGAVTGFTFNLVGAGTGAGGVARNTESFSVSSVKEGTDTLTDVEQIRFESTTYTLRLGTDGSDNVFVGGGGKSL